MRLGHLCAFTGARHGTRPRLLRSYRGLDAAGDVPKGVRAAEGDDAPFSDTERHAALDDFLIDTAAALECLPQVAISDDAATKIRLGNSVIIRGRDAPLEAEEACATARGKLVAIGAIEQGMFKPKRVFAD